MKPQTGGEIRRPHGTLVEWCYWHMVWLLQMDLGPGVLKVCLPGPVSFYKILIVNYVCIWCGPGVGQNSLPGPHCRLKSEVLVGLAIFSCSLSNKLFIGIKGNIFFITFVGQIENIRNYD